jgi:aminopeptidase
MTTPDFARDLDTYAELAVKIGVGLQPGQRLLIRAALDTAPLVRLVAAHAYKQGARLVETIWNDPQLLLARYNHAPRDSFDEHTVWWVNAGIEYAERGDAVLTIHGVDPDLLQGQDPRLIATAQRAEALAARRYYDYIIGDAINWSIVAYAVEPWAAKVFADAPADEQVDRLWQSIFDICRVSTADPLAAWHSHDSMLNARADFLTGRGYHALHLTGPGTDLTVGLADSHRWMGGGSTPENGAHCVPNMPTEEVFTTPHRDRVDGTVTATMPLNYGGNLIDGFAMTFKDGRVVDYSAEQGGDLLKSLIEMDEGAACLGEMALVPNSSPIAQTGRLFYNTLYDENAASHVALGRAYKKCIDLGDDMTDAQFAAAGGNDSITHVDFMIGSAAVDVDGLLSDGTAEPLMRGGEFVTGPR